MNLNGYSLKASKMWQANIVCVLLMQAWLPSNGLLEREQSRALPIQMDMGNAEAITICTGLKRYIACRDGSNIAVTHAFWGRTSDKICPSDDGDPVTDCEGSEDTLGLVKGYCESKNQCQLEARHSVLQQNGSHHCPGVNKYLIVNFTCIPESKGVTLCDSAETVISCESNWVMELADVFWGRRASTKYCGAEEGMECDSSEAAGKYLKAKCNNQRKCLVKADPAVLDNAHSPCAGMLKYLMVNYICRPSSVKTRDDGDDDDKILSDTSSKELMGLLEKHLNEIKTPENASSKDKTTPLNVEEKKIEPKQYSKQTKQASSKSHTRTTLGRAVQPFVANEEEEIANSIVNGPAFARTIKKQDVTIPVTSKKDESNSRPRKDEIFESIDAKDSSKKEENSLIAKDTITKSDDSYEVTEPNTVRSILARAKEVLKTLDGDPSNAPQPENVEDILNKRGGIARNKQSDDKLSNQTASAAKQVANLAQSLISSASKSKKKNLSNKLKEAAAAAVAQKPKPASSKRFGYRTGTGSAGIGNTP